MRALRVSTYLLCLVGMVCVLLAAPSWAEAQASKRAAAPGPSDGKSESELGMLAEGFGVSVTMSGRLALVGESRSSLEPGTVTVFHRDSTTEVWSQEAVLVASAGTAGNRFGEIIDADGNRVIVGAPEAFGGEGAAYIYVRQSPGVWSEEAILQSPVPTAGNWFARTSVSISGDFAVVGETHYGGANQGSAHIFAFDGGSWAPDTTLPKVASGDRFGFSAAISGNRAVIGAYRWNPNATMQRLGAAYVYERSGSGWSPMQMLTVPDSIPYDHFGYHVAIDGDLIAASNYSTNGIRPQAYRMFEYESGGSTWVLRDTVENEGIIAIDVDSLTTISGVGDLNQVSIRSGSAGGAEWSIEDNPLAAGLSPGDNFGYSVGLSGNYAVVGAPGAFVGATRAYFFERQPDSTWLEVESFVGTGTPTSITGASISCSGGTASVFSCKDINLQSYLNRTTLLATGDLSDIWGWTDPDTGHEYALVTHGGGTTFVDVTDPVNPVVVGILPLHEGTVNSAWRDVKTYADHAFIVADNAGPQGIQVLDLGELRIAQGLSSAAAKAGGTASLPVTFAETAHYNKFTRAHNIAINDSSGTAFVVGSTLCGGGIHIVDISSPIAPDSTGCYADATTGRSGTGYTHDIQCVTYHGPDATYAGREICFGSNETALLIADVSDNANGFTIGKGEYPDYGYVHQGWLTEDHRYFVLDDELDEIDGVTGTTRTLFWNVTDLSDPILEYEYVGPSPAIDHNQYVRGHYLYQAQYLSGIRILDISGVTEATASKNSLVTPVEVAFFDTYPPSNATAFGGAWSVFPYFESGNIVVSSMGEGLFVLQPQLTELTASIKVFLEGPFVAGIDSMETSPLFEASVPRSNPYRNPLFDGSMLELDAADSVTVLPTGVIDWIVVELRASTEAGSAVAARAAVLLADGSVVDPNGNALRFPGVGGGNYYIVIHHRNHLSIMSSSPVDFNSDTGIWDFTTSSDQAFGVNPMRSLPDGRWGMYAGESNLDEVNSVGDFAGWFGATKSALTGYVLTDYNLDGNVLVDDFGLWFANTKTGASSQVP